MSAPSLLNAAGRRRSPFTLPGYMAGRTPRNKGLRYPPDPPTIERIVAVMWEAGDRADDARMQAFIVVLWRAGCRARARCSCATARAARWREVGTGPWGWDHFRPWLELRMAMPVGPLLCVVDGAHPRAAVGERRRTRPAAPRPCRRARPRGVSLNVIQRQPGHTNLAVTSIYLQGIDTAEIIAAVHARKSPMIPASTCLRIE
jgi:hypothetical protein